MQDKREWFRFDIQLNAAARGLETSRAHKVTVININQQGFCFVSAGGHKPGDRVELTVELQGLGPARLMTEVVWSGFFKKDGCHHTGVRITTTDPAEHEKFIKFYKLKLLCAPKPSRPSA